MPLKFPLPLWKTLLWVSVIGLGIGLALPAVQVPGYGGKLIPVDLPDEKNRLWNDAGFSLILPPDWKTFNRDFESGGGSLEGAAGFRYPSRLGVTCFGREQEPWGGIDPSWQRTTFQGQPAFIEVGRDTAWESAKCWRTLYFQRGGLWFALSATARGKHDDLPPIFTRYLNTFRFVPPRLELPLDPFLHEKPNSPGG